VFVETMKAAVDEYLRMRSEGVDREDAERGLEAVLRESWPKPPSKFPPACEDCHGTGYREMTCWDQQRCQRESHATWSPALEHTYVVLCSCIAGDRFRRAKLEPVDEMASVGRGRKRKPTGWTKL
jgi:hypothetical protein